MPEENDNNERGREFEIIEKIKVLNVKKGDVLILKYSPFPPDNHPIPNHRWSQMNEKLITMVKNFVQENWSGKIGLLSIPNTIDLEVIRLEEWFV